MTSAGLVQTTSAKHTRTFQRLQMYHTCACAWTPFLYTLLVNSHFYSRPLSVGHWTALAALMLPQLHLHTGLTTQASHLPPA